MATIELRDLHLVKKALCIAILAIESRPGPDQPASDQFDMKLLLDRLIDSNMELEHYTRLAKAIIWGSHD